jgi:tetratricopeptide (TPR) repeat protein
MKRILSGLIPLAVAVFFGARIEPCAAAGAADKVRLARGSENGEVSDMSPLKVTLSNGAANTRTVDVNQIKAIVFDGEPSELTQARVSMSNGGFAKAAQLLEKIDLGQVRRDFIKQDVEFYQACAAARLALGGDGDVLDAGRKLNAFVRSYPNNIHYLEASETMGDLLMMSGRFEHAQKQYGELAKAPWPDYKMRAAVAIGRSLQAQNKHAEAIQQFDAALAIGDDGPDAQTQKLAATLGKAVSLADTGKVDEAAGMIEKIIQDADPQQRELHARAYNALGTCYEMAKRDKDALLAFLHVDVLYSTVPDAHAEALSHLVPLWRSIGQDERSRESRELLQQRYAGSRWAKQLQ